MLNVKVLFLELHIRNTLSGEKRLLTKLRKDLHDTLNLDKKVMLCSISPNRIIRFYLKSAYI